MKNQTLLIALKWTGIQYATMTALGFLFFYLKPETQLLASFGTILMYLSQMGFYVFAIRELENKFGKQMSPAKAFELGGWFLGINLVLFVLVFSIADLFSGNAYNLDLIGAEDILLMFGASVLYLAIIFLILTFYGLWRVFTKAGKPGWASIVPIYNAIVHCEIGQKPSWWVVMLFIPIVNLVFAVMILNGISKAFGKDEGFTAGLVLLPFVFFPILGFGPDRWIYGPEEVTDETAFIEDHLVD